MYIVDLTLAIVSVSKIHSCNNVIGFVCNVYYLFLDSVVSDKKATRRVVPPKITITKADSNKMETCERHISQLLVRGEHVVFIVVLNAEKESET